MFKTLRFPAWLLTLGLCLSLLVPPASAASDIYFTSINDNLLPLTSDTMPYRSGGILYVPYTVFDSNDSGVSLGISCAYNRSHNSVLLYNTTQVLTFYPDTGICYDEIAGRTYSNRAIMRNGRPFLALDTVCRFFDLVYTYNILPSISNGYLVRVKSDAVILSDDKFIDAAKNSINRRYQTYIQSLTPSEEPTPSAPPTPPPIEEPADPHQVSTYLAFLCGDPDAVSSVLNTLDRTGVYGLFLAAPEWIQAEDALVRRILGTGHSIGIWASGDSLEESQQILAEGSRQLEALTYSRTTIAYAPKSQHSALEAEGWICWNESLSLTPSSAADAGYYASQTLDRLSGRTKSTYLTLDCGPGAVRVLPSLLDRLEEEYFILSIPLETRL